MSTALDLPASFNPENPLANPGGNGAWSAEYDADGGEQAVSWVGPFADRLAFRDAVLYTPETVSVGGASITRVVPLECPYDPALHARKLSLRALSSEESEAVDAAPWELIVATVHFGVLPYPTTGDSPFISIRSRSNPKRFTIPNYAYVLVDDSNVFVEAVAQDVGIPIFEEQIEVTWHGIVDLPGALATLEPMLDKVNDATITLPDLGMVCPPGTLHLAGRNASKSISVGGVVKAELSVILSYRNLPWNRALGSGGTPRWVAPSGALSSRPIASASFAPLVGY